MAASLHDETHSDSIQGLTDAEAADRRQRGLGNDFTVSSSRSYRTIIISNIFNLINIILFTIGGVMLAIGRAGDALTSVGLIVFNVLISIVQEIRAKQQLDRIALLNRPTITAIRNGQERTINPSDIVVDDILLIRAGDQVVVDGVLVGDKTITMDESLLTGESDQVEKNADDEILSGSFCVSGTGYMRATIVGEASFANKLTQGAREFQMSQTPLQREINFILRVLMLVSGFIGILIVLSAIVAATPFVREVQMAAVVAGLIPNGLFFMVILSYALGALRIVQQGALVQQTNAVESLSNITVLCTDKTGTLTANRIKYEDVHPIGIEKAKLEKLLGEFVTSMSTSNKTSEAIMAALKADKIDLLEEIPFTSALKWSAIAREDGVYVLGATAMLAPYMPLDDDIQAKIEDWTGAGMRVLAFGYNSQVKTLYDATGTPTLPPLTPLGILKFSDELRPHLKETLAAFARNNIQLKVISGDAPETVAALAKQAGFPGDLKYVSGVDLNTMADAEFAQTALESTVFGRITPDQKERLVDALRQQGHYVAMIGDGVNDVLSLKKADIGIAMQSGSSATRSVADMVLLNDSFGVLPAAFTEGQRILNGMEDILRLFLTRVLYAALLIVATAVVGIGFPFLPKHNALVAAFAVGLPTLALALWARPGQRKTTSILRTVAHFVLPAGLSITVFGLLVYFAAFYLGLFELVDVEITPELIASFEEYTGIDYAITNADAYTQEAAHLTAQTALTIFATWASLLLVLFVEPPHPIFVGGDVYSGDVRPTLLALLCFIGFTALLLIEPLRSFFELLALPLWGFVLLAIVTALWAVILRMAWRNHWLDRFLGVRFDLTKPEVPLPSQ
ncbi:MAG: HAD-IC family P-type ATPase [Anaerolineae bacterium]|nr:HAD-IC family P-type ATPase [Anaerolineae bacterium]